MRASIERTNLSPVASSAARVPVAGHALLWLQRMAPLPDSADGRLTSQQKDAHLDAVAGIPVPSFYARAYTRWRESLEERAQFIEIELTSRLLVGHGDPSPTEVGVTLHPTYGVPYIPGTALKGLLSHYIQATRGGEPGWRAPIFRAKKTDTTAPLGDGDPVEPPGEWYAAVFGAPAITGKADVDAKGYVRFEDALLVPNPGGQRPLIRDVLTPHHKTYYDSHGEKRPIDWDEPNPVGFLTVAPGTRFLLAVSWECGAEAWADLAVAELLSALETRGVGGKTSAGYGRATRATGAPVAADDDPGAAHQEPANVVIPQPQTPPAPETPAANLVTLTVLTNAAKEFANTQQSKLDAFARLDFPRLARSVHPNDQGKALKVLNDYNILSHPKLKREVGAVLAEVRAILTPSSDE